MIDGDVARSGTRVVVFTDLVDSTALAVTGAVAASSFWAGHDRRSRDLLRACAGIEVGRSDGFLLLFDNAADAVRFAHGYHAIVGDLRGGARARVGIHRGLVTVRRNAHEDAEQGATPFEVDGVPVHVGARIMALARGQQTLLSEAVVDDLGDTGKTLPLGYWRLKGVEDPLRLFALADGSGDLEPPDDGEKAYQVVVVNGQWRPVRDVRHSVPAERDSFIGRRLFLLDIARRLERGARLVSVLGPGGAGKTRLATRFARAWLGDFPGGVWFCELSQATSLDGVLFAIAKGLDVELGKAEPGQLLAEAILGRGRCLVVVDNFEQVVDLASVTIGRWLAHAEKACFLVTSRERLKLPGEHVLWLAPLDDDESVRLFRERAEAVMTSSNMGATDDALIVRLTRLLDGLPLAIELAAARLNIMSPTEMLARIEKRFELLTSRGGRHDRQATLRATIDWSWELLSISERSALAQLSVFTGGFTLPGAEAVINLDGGARAGPVFDALQSLLDKSLLRSEADGRFGLLESIRAYAAQKLEFGGGTDGRESLLGVQARHGRYYADMPLKRAKEDALEIENIVVACRNAVLRQDTETAVSTCVKSWELLSLRGPISVCRELIEDALHIESLSNEQTTELRNVLGRCLLRSGDPAQARVLLVSAMEMARRDGFERQEVMSLTWLAEVNAIDGRLDEAKAFYETAIDKATLLGDMSSLSAALNGLGTYYGRVGRLNEANGCFRKALVVAEANGDRRWQGGAMSNLGQVAANLGRREEARSWYARAVALARGLGDRAWEGNLLCNSGLLHLEEGRPHDAAIELHDALLRARECGHVLLESVVLCNLALLHESLDEPAQACDWYDAAIKLARRRQDKRGVGQYLGYLGLLLIKQGRHGEGGASLREAIQLLREVGDANSLGIVLCQCATVSAMYADDIGAEGMLAKARKIATEIGVEPTSELAVAISKAEAQQVLYGRENTPLADLAAGLVDPVNFAT